jgi:vacuolar protein sorting-associated protein 54
MLLNDLDKIKKEFADHNEKVLNKFVTIIGGIVEHGLAKHIGGIDFDERAKDGVTENGVACCVFLEGVLTNTRKMHQVLSALLPPEHLQDVFSRIFAFLDQKTPALFIAAAENDSGPGGKKFSFPTTDAGKKRLLDEVDSVTRSLNALEGVFPWDFSTVTVLAKKLEVEIPDRPSLQQPETTAACPPSKGGELVEENGQISQQLKLDEPASHEDLEVIANDAAGEDDAVNGQHSSEVADETSKPEVEVPDVANDLISKSETLESSETVQPPEDADDSEGQNPEFSESENQVSEEQALPPS